MKKLFVCLFVFLFAGMANAAVIDFEGVLTGGAQFTLNNVTPYTEDGFTLTSSGDPGVFHNDIFAPASGANTNGSDIFGWCGAGCPGSPFTLSVTNGGLFNLSSIDFSSLFLNDSVGIIDVVGYFFGGGSITQSFDFDDSLWTTILFPGFSNLTSFSIAARDVGGDLAMDNIVLTSGVTVPEPASIALLGLGFAALGVSRKNKVS